MVFEKAKALANVNPADCAHEWEVQGTAIGPVHIEVYCPRCMTFGVVCDPSKEEWNEAFGIYERRGPYSWKDGSRVTYARDDNARVG